MWTPKERCSSRTIPRYLIIRGFHWISLSFLVFYCVLKWSDTLEAVLMQLRPRSGADRLPEASGYKKIARVIEIFSLCVCSVTVMKSRTNYSRFIIWGLFTHCDRPLGSPLLSIYFCGFSFILTNTRHRLLFVGVRVPAVRASDRISVGHLAVTFVLESVREPSQAGYTSGYTSCTLGTGYAGMDKSLVLLLFCSFPFYLILLTKKRCWMESFLFPPAPLLL